MTDKLKTLCKKASEIILSFPKSTRIRVISHYDADGITAAAIICKALYRTGYDFHATLMRNPFDKGLARVSKEENELIIFTEEVKSFVGLNAEQMGPFDKGEIANLPKEISKILIEGGKAQRIL